MSGLRVYSTSVTGSREVSVCLGRRRGKAGRFPVLRPAPGSRPHDGGSEVRGMASQV